MLHKRYKITEIIAENKTFEEILIETDKTNFKYNDLDIDEILLRLTIVENSTF